jgi:hypothetical protein
MGFKLTYQMLGASNTGSATGTNSFSMPFNAQSGITNARQLIDDIGSTDVQNVQRLIESSDNYDIYGSQTGGNNFGITSCEGYLVKMINDTNYVVVGSHAPSFCCNLNAFAAGVSATGTNLFSMPYHHTAANARNLIDDIGSTDCQNVQKFVESSDNWDIYGSTTGGNNFSLVPGEAYLVKMVNDNSCYRPSHF